MTRARRVAHGRLSVRTAPVVLELVIGGLAVAGAVGLVRNGIGMPVEWLGGSAFASWTWPGVVLFAVIAAPMLGAAAAEITNVRYARALSITAGVAQVVWIVGQLIVVQRYFVLQPLFAAAGLLVIAPAVSVHPIATSSRSPS